MKYKVWINYKYLLLNILINKTVNFLINYNALNNKNYNGLANMLKVPVKFC